MRLATTHIAALLLLSVLMMACRGQKTEKPPVALQQNMMFQDRFNAQEPNPFFADNRSMRQPVEGTIARGNLKDDAAFYQGVDENGEFVEENPMDVSQSFLYRGQDRYDIYCTPCHGGLGDGQGIIMTGQYGYVPSPTFHRQASYDMPDGEIYSAITNGIRNMPSYASQVKTEDRWAIVAYIRALQESQNIPATEIEQFDVDLVELQEEYQTEVERDQELADARDAGAGDEVSAELGEQLYVQNGCQACHSTDGTQILGPTFQGLFESEKIFADGSTGIADEEYLRESIIDPSAQIVDGFDNVMPPFSYLAENEVQSIVEYIKTLSEN